MALFLANLLTFPTLIYTVLLGVMLVYWLLAAIGTLEIELFDIDIDIDADVDALEGFAGLLFRLGLAGVPLTVVLTALALVGWSVCYFTMLWLVNPLFDGWLHGLLSVVLCIAALIIAIPVTAMVTRPLRPLFRGSRARSVHDLVGQIVVIRTSKVTDSFGEATLMQDGADLILKVRSDDTCALTRGDRAVIIEYLEPMHAYRVMSEAELLKDNPLL